MMVGIAIQPGTINPHKSTHASTNAHIAPNTRIDNRRMSNESAIKTNALSV